MGNAITNPGRFFEKKIAHEVFGFPDGGSHIEYRTDPNLVNQINELKASLNAQGQQQEAARKNYAAQIRMIDDQNKFKAQQTQQNFDLRMRNFEGKNNEEKLKLQQQHQASLNNLKSQMTTQMNCIQKKLQKAEEMERKRLQEIELLKNYPPQPFQLTAFFKNGIHVAITGPSRAGKSTLINTVRGLRSKDPIAAKVKHGVEGTLTPTPYIMDRLTEGAPQIVLWDVPGHSTVRFPLETYLRDMGLRYFNAVVMVTQDVFTEGDLKLTNEMKEHHVPFIMVRNKIDETIRSAEEEGEDVFSILENIRFDFQRQGLDQVFLICAFLSKIDQFDMPKLVDEIPKLRKLAVPILCRMQKQEKVVTFCCKFFSGSAGDHGLKSFKTPNDFICDKCENIFKKGSNMYGCRICDFDLCTNCCINVMVKNMTTPNWISLKPNQHITFIVDSGMFDYYLCLAPGSSATFTTKNSRTVNIQKNIWGPGNITINCNVNCNASLGVHPGNVLTKQCYQYTSMNFTEHL